METDENSQKLQQYNENMVNDTDNYVPAPEQQNEYQQNLR